MISKVFTRTITVEDFKIIDDNLVKTAEFKLPDGIKYDPDFLYLKVRAVSAGEAYGCNKNGDYFPEKELKKSFKTFLQAHAFKNHNNKDVAGAIGDVLTAEYDDEMKTVLLLIRIDRNIAPSIVRGFEKGYMTDVSMGCRVDHVLCSYCGKKAKKRSEYCDHLLTMKKSLIKGDSDKNKNGIRVFEINIGPKFHDISAVLNGAEKVAKAAGIYIHNGKVAAVEGESSLEKVASEYTLQQSLISNEEFADLNKVALNDDMEEALDKVAFDSTSFIDKIAEIKKELQAKVVQSATGEYLIDRFRKASELRDLLKLVYTKYWDKEKCNEIAEKLKEIAFEKGEPVPCVFNQFLRVLDFAGIELSPLEVKMISSTLMGEDFNIDEDNDINEDIMNEVDTISDKHDMGTMTNIPEVFESIRSILRNRENVNNIISSSPDKMNSAKAIIIKIKRPEEGSNSNMMQSIMNIIRPEMPSRSYHRNFIVRRVTDPIQYNNVSHFTPIRGNSLHDILNTILYSTYQGDRVRRLNSGDLEFGFSKFASYIEEDTLENSLMLDMEKSAGLKALALGLPLTFGYSALQRSRIRNGENVNGLNRYIAENPANAYVMQALGYHGLKRGTKAIGKGIKKGTKAIGGGIKDVGQKTKEFFTPKKACFLDDEGLDKIALQKFSNDELTAIKKALVLSEIDEDASMQILEKEALTSDDLSSYLKMSSNYLKIEIEDIIEKEASLAGSALKDAAGMLLFSRKKPVFSSNLPAALIDGAAMTLLGKKLSDKGKASKAVKPMQKIDKVENKM